MPPAEHVDPLESRNGFKPQTVVWLCGAIYAIGVLAFFLRGQGIFAAVLTFPAALLILPVAAALSESVLPFLTTVPGNMLVLMLAASGNVAGAALLVRWLTHRKRISATRGGTPGR